MVEGASNSIVPKNSPESKPLIGWTQGERIVNNNKSL